MTFNPSKQGDVLNPATQRKNSTNDPGFENNLGYFPYDLSHTEVLTPLYGLITPSLHLVTSPGDRHVIYDDCKTILNQIQGNFLNTVNQYTDTFFVSNKTMFPNNWDKLIPNPVKGDDVPHSARPVVPLIPFIYNLLNSEHQVAVCDSNGDYQSYTLGDLSSSFIFTHSDGIFSPDAFSFLMSYVILASYITSRGQLLDYLGFQFDLEDTVDYYSSYQYSIDRLHAALWKFVDDNAVSIGLVDFNESISEIDFSQLFTGDESQLIAPNSLSDFRNIIFTGLERGKLFYFNFDNSVDSSYNDLVLAYQNFYERFDSIFQSYALTIANIDKSTDPFADGYSFNISKVLAYQLSVAEYYTNDSVDNIYTADLYMQLLRAVMFPSLDGFSQEPTFDYNGVATEYDLISYGGFYSSFLRETEGCLLRAYRVSTLLFIMRNSLRYGDYFTTGRTRMLAVGQLSVPVEGAGNLSVNPVDITIGIVSQRFLNAANRVGNKPMAYYASMFGITPSDDIAKPRYVSHRKIVLESRLTNNTADNQGAQTTNLVGFSDNNACDVFIDDFGVLLSVISYDVLPIYTTGLDADNRLSDRFEFFNPMMQNIGDEAIRLSEIDGCPRHFDYTFAYTVRNREYKYKLSKAHGALCYNMPGFLLRMPVTKLFNRSEFDELRISPEFIRDRPQILDSIIYSSTGASPGDYFHFITSVHNAVKSARTIQKAPPILF